MAEQDVHESEGVNTLLEHANHELRVFAQFCETSSIPALPKLSATKSVVVRTIWVLILLGGTSVFIWQASLLVGQFMTKPVTVTVTVVNEKVIDFPSVTICNMNPLRASMLLYPNRFKSLVDLDRKLENSNDTTSNKTKSKIVKRDVEAIAHRLKKRDDAIDSTSDLGQEQPPEQPSEQSPEQPLEEPTPPTADDITSFDIDDLFPLDPNDDSPADSDSIYPSPAPDDYSGTGENGDTTPENDEQPADESNNDDGVVLQDDFSYLQGITDENDFLGMMKVSKSDDFADILKLIQVTRQEARNFGHTAEDMILTCSFDGFKCTTKDFYPFENKKYGRCYTFNSAVGTKMLRTTRFGIENGLQLTLNPEPNEYVSMLAPSMGFRVLVHPHDSRPYPESFGANAATGLTTIIGIRKNVVKRLEGFTNCTNTFPDNSNNRGSSNSVPREKVTRNTTNSNSTTTTKVTTAAKVPLQTTAATHSSEVNKTAEVDATQFSEKVYGYSINNCIEDCVQHLLMNTCNCSDEMQDDSSDGSLCSFLDELQTQCRNDVYQQYNSGELSCNCPQECNDIFYSSSISSSEWPTIRYSRVLAKTLGKRLNGTSINQLVNVKVYFEELNHQQIEEADGYPIEKLLADLGGTIGLYIGLCVCSLFEIFEFFIILAQMAWISRKRNKVAAARNNFLTTEENPNP